MVTAGELDQRIVIEAVIEGTGPYGGVETVWSEFASVWARVIPLRGDESFEAARTNAVRVIKVKLRWLDGVRTTMRLVWRGETYDIADVDESGRRKGELWLMAKARGV